MSIQKLHDALSSVCPIVSVNSNKEVIFSPEATKQQRTDALSVVATWNLANEELAEATKAALADIDLRSIRAIREYIAAKPDAPKILKDREAEATAERVKLK